MKDIIEKIAEIKAQRRLLDKVLVNLESEIYYSKMESTGVDANDINRYKEQDREALTNALAFKDSFNGLRNTFFGYPGNLNLDSPLVRYLRKEEAELYYVNNCGDPYEEGNSPMDGKEFEREILRLFYKKFGIDEDRGWGYVTSGGTESNTWAIRNGFRKYPDGMLYFCGSAHYSVEKSVLNGNTEIFPYTVILKGSGPSEKIDSTALLEAIKKNSRPAVILLTWGTTKLGSVDDVEYISSELKKLGIPFYLHVDAAFFGGIPNNQKQAPVCPTLDKMGADSVSVSFHKFFGVPNINSVVLSKDKADGKEISYLGQRDTTIAGSRTFPVFSALQRMREVLERSPEDYYSKNVEYFQAALEKKGVNYFRDGHSNIFIVPRPPEDVLKKFQLPTFEDSDGNITLAHIIINPFHTMGEMDLLLSHI